MKILGICGSTRKSDVSGGYHLVETVLAETGCEYEIFHLKGKKISGCIACLGCVKDNVCKVDDDLAPLRQQIVNADAFVIGAPNYYSTFNAATHALLERWFQFRHQTGDLLWGKLAVAVGVGGTSGEFPANTIEQFLLYNFIETVAKVSGQGAASCYSCGHGEDCQVGIPVMTHGEGVKITDDMIPDVRKQPEVIAAAKAAGRQLGERLRNGHNRQQVTATMQAKLMEMFQDAV